ncbi:hypothetical protein LJC59_06890 [Desulfovibrio sp. OttesenSCG-928-A18]|nr:hypothetical protein [Desulfovibrio sp. OttesenSCG-928-A18]
MRFTTVALICLALALTLAMQGTALAVPLKNESGAAIDSVYCVTDDLEVQRLLGPLAADAQADIPEAKLGDECTRLLVYRTKEEGYTFYVEPALGAATEIVLSMDQVSLVSEARYPSLLVDIDGDAHVCPAGVPLWTLSEQLQIGMNRDTWRALTASEVPGYSSGGAFVVSFADVSWSLCGDGIRYSELAEDAELADFICLTAPFSNPVLLAILTDIRELDGSPVPALVEGKKVRRAFSAEGRQMRPEATLDKAMEAASDEQRWDAALEALAELAEDGGVISYTFVNESKIIVLKIDLGTSTATLSVEHKAGGALG